MSSGPGLGLPLEHAADQVMSFRRTLLNDLLQFSCHELRKHKTDINGKVVAFAPACRGSPEDGTDAHKLVGFTFTGEQRLVHVEFGGNTPDCENVDRTGVVG